MRATGTTSATWPISRRGWVGYSSEAAGAPKPLSVGAAPIRPGRLGRRGRSPQGCTPSHGREPGERHLLGHRRQRHLRPVVAAYERALDRAGRILTDTARLGLKERFVRLRSAQGEQIAKVIREALDDLGVAPEREAVRLTVIGRFSMTISRQAEPPSRASRRVSPYLALNPHCEIPLRAPWSSPARTTTSMPSSRCPVSVDDLPPVSSEPVVLVDDGGDLDSGAGSDPRSRWSARRWPRGPGKRPRGSSISQSSVNAASSSHRRSSSSEVFQSRS